MKKKQGLLQQLEDLYKKDPYFLLVNTAKSLTKKLNISSATLYVYLNKLNITKKQSIINLVKNNPPYTISAFELIKKYNLNNVTVATLKRYSKKIHGMPYYDFNKKKELELQEEIQEMLEEYEFPLLQLGREKIIQYLGISKNKYYKIKRNKRWSIKKEYKKLFSRYPLEEYSRTELATIINRHPDTITEWVHKLNLSRKHKKAISMNVIKARRERYGRLPVKEQRKKIPYKQFKVWFENKLLSQKEISVKEIKEYLNRIDIAKVIYYIKNHYGLINYTFDHVQLKYILKENNDL